MNTSWTKGWKGYLGGLILVLAGFYGLIVSLSSEQPSGNNLDFAALIGLGLGILGIRHRQDR